MHSSYLEHPTHGTGPSSIGYGLGANTNGGSETIKSPGAKSLDAIRNLPNCGE